ncbi:hypothetical protein LTR51_005905 [Lithohypha guttulata]|nr:hypothetical protein LTR51_005905 [Lithohypha guttulata]
MMGVMVPLSLDCLLSAAYVCLSFFLACPSPAAHLVAEPVDALSTDLRLHDFGRRAQLDRMCLAALVRAVHAARHSAYHYNTWCHRHRSNSLDHFTLDTFGPGVRVEDIHVMVRDGQRLAWLENESGCGYVGFIVALDWRRFQTTSDPLLLALAKDVLALPSVRGLLTLLSPQWPRESFGHYHDVAKEKRVPADAFPEQVVQYGLGSLHRRGSLLHTLSHRCRGCVLFPHPPNIDARLCVGCRRGGFPCRGASVADDPSPPDASAFLSCAIELLERVDAKCDGLVNRVGSIGSAGAVGSDDANIPSETTQSVRWSSVCTDGTRSSWIPRKTAQQIRMMELLLHLDQKLERLGGMETPDADKWDTIQGRKRQRRSSSSYSIQRRRPAGPHAVPHGCRSSPLPSTKEEEKEEEEEEEQEELSRRFYPPQHIDQHDTGAPPHYINYTKLISAVTTSTHPHIPWR